MKISQDVQSLISKGLIYYEHGDQPGRLFLVMSSHAGEAEIEIFLKQSKQIQIFADHNAWEDGVRPGNDLHQRGDVLSCELNVKGIQAVFKALNSWELYKCEGWNRLVLRAFPRGDLFVKTTPESVIFEMLALLDQRQKFVFISEVEAPWGDAAGQAEYLNTYGLASVQEREIKKARILNHKLIANTGMIEAPLKCGDLEVHSFYSPLDRQYHWAFTTKNFGQENTPPLVRIESECLTGHMLGSLLCDCGQQLEQGLMKIRESGHGALLYLRQEGRGIGLLNKLKAYKLQQEDQLDTVDANLAIGEPEDARDYLIGALMLRHFKVEKLHLLTNNPAKVKGLEQYGLEITERVAHVIPPSKHNEFYLSTKKERMGHLI
jgi:GTP cyclohydrolase II